MHYGATEFSKNGNPTIVAKQSGITLLKSWQKNYITEQDAAEINKYYNCS